MRILVRLARGGDGLPPFSSALAARLERAPTDAARAFDLAGAGSPPPRARTANRARTLALVEDAIAADPSAPHALRALEGIARASGSMALLANALGPGSREAFASDAPRLGALVG